MISKKNIEYVLRPYQYSDNYGIVDITDIYGGVIRDVPSYVVAFQPNGFGQTLLIHLGNKEEILRTIYVNRFSGDVRNMPGNVTKIKELLNENEKIEADIEENY